MMGCARAVLIASLFAAGAARAAPVLAVDDTYAANAWLAPANCLGVNSPFTNSCPGPVTALPGSVDVQRSNAAPGAQGSTGAASTAGGVLITRVGLRGPGFVQTRARFRESYTYVGPNTAAYVVPFTILPFRVSTQSAVGDVRRIDVRFDIRRDATLAANLDWAANSIGNGVPDDLVTTPAPFGFVPPPGFLIGGAAGIDSSSFFGAGGVIAVDLGAFTTGQSFTLRYNMRARCRGNAVGECSGGLGDPFNIPTGQFIDFGGLAIPANPVPAPAALALFGLGAAALIGRRAR